MGYLCLLKIAISDKDKEEFVPSGDYITTRTGALSPTGSERKK